MPVKYLLLNGDTSVMLDPDGDHIVVRYFSHKGYERELTLGRDTEAWTQAVERAQRGSVFCD